MMALNLTRQIKLNRSIFNQVSVRSASVLAQSASASTIKIKVDGKPIDIGSLPKKPKLNLFEKYCKEKGVTGDQLKSQKTELLKSFKEDQAQYIAENKKLVEDYKKEMKAYNNLFKQPVQLKDLKPLIKFYNKTTEKLNQPKKPRKLSFYNFFIKQAHNETSSADLKAIAQKYKSLSPSELDHYKSLYEDHLKQL